MAQLDGIRLSAHAEEMMEERGIASAWVQAAVFHPDWSEPDPRDPALTRSFRAIPDAGGRVLRVVHRPEPPGIFVVTAHFDRGAGR
ncbi:MAG: DUF4258 domain-containing protein [Roseomonas sp.]|nr:DUF4258 domain-containing protein [Roseomonas sp.]